MIKDNLINYRAELRNNQWEVLAFNTENNQDEVVKIYPYNKKQCAYSLVSRRNNALKHVIHYNYLDVIMTKMNISNKELAEKTHLRSETIRNWRANRFQPSYGSLSILSMALGIKEDELIAY